MEEIIRLASEIGMIAFCLLVGPADQKEVRIDLVGTRGLMDTVVAERTARGFALYDERDREHGPFLTLERRAEKPASFVAKGAKSQESVIDLSTELAQLNGLERRAKVQIKTERGSEILLVRSGMVTYVTESRSDRTYAVHGADRSLARRGTGTPDDGQVKFTTRVYPLRYGDPQKLTDIVRPILAGTGEVSVDERTRSLIVTAPSDVQEQIAATLGQLDVEER